MQTARRRRLNGISTKTQWTIHDQQATVYTRTQSPKRMAIFKAYVTDFISYWRRWLRVMNMFKMTKTLCVVLTKKILRVLFIHATLSVVFIAWPLRVTLIHADLRVVFTDRGLRVVIIHAAFECSACSQCCVYTQTTRISLHAGVTKLMDATVGSVNPFSPAFLPWEVKSSGVRQSKTISGRFWPVW